MQPVAPWKYIRRHMDIRLNPITYSGLATPQDLLFFPLKWLFLETVHCMVTSFLFLLAFFGRYTQCSLPVWTLNINTPKKHTFLTFCKIGNYKPRSDAEMSAQPWGTAAKWFMVLYLLVGRWAHGAEWVLRRARPPTLIFQNWATQEQTLTLLTLNKTSILLHFVGLA